MLRGPHSAYICGTAWIRQSIRRVVSVSPTHAPSRFCKKCANLREAATKNAKVTVETGKNVEDGNRVYMGQRVYLAEGLGRFYRRCRLWSSQLPCNRYDQCQQRRFYARCKWEGKKTRLETVLQATHTEDTD